MFRQELFFVEILIYRRNTLEKAMSPGLDRLVQLYAGGQGTIIPILKKECWLLMASMMAAAMMSRIMIDNHVGGGIGKTCEELVKRT